MTDPKISVGADVSGVEAALKRLDSLAQKVNQTLSSGEIPLNLTDAEKDLEALSGAAKAVVDQLEAAKEAGKDLASLDMDKLGKVMGGAAASAETLQQVFDKVGKSSGLANTVKDAKALTDHLNRAIKAQQALAKEGIKLSHDQAAAAKKSFDEWRRSGARGTAKIRNVEFDDWVSGQWRSYSMDEAESRRHRRAVLGTVGVETPDDEPGGGNSRRRKFGRGAAAAAGALGGMAGRIMQGGDGGMVSALGSGAGSLIGAGVGFAAGGPIGAAVGAFASNLLGGVGSAIDAGVQRVVEQNNGLTDLRHSLGATTTDFDTLRGAVMYFTENLGVTGQEAVRLSRSFAEAAGKALDASDVGQATGGAIGFARGYGMDPNAATQFFGMMRHFGVTKDASEDKRLALLIGEAVGRNGMNPKMGEFMGAIQSYVETQSRASLTAANTSAYASFLSSMTGLSLTGLKGDPTTAMGAMGAADSALRQGGAFGEASRIFSLAMYQRRMPGFNAFDMGYMNDQGAFGTIGRAFGADSPAMAMARAMGDKGAMARYSRWASGPNANDTILSMQMREIESRYGRYGAEGMTQAIQSHFGVNAGQASALYTAFKSDNGLGGLSSMLQSAGVDIGKVNPAQIAALAQVANMDGAGLRKEAGRLLDSGQLTSAERGKLNAALQSGKDEDIKKMVLNLNALHDTTRDSGQAMREQQANMVRSLDKLAEVAIPYIATIKDGMLALIKKIAPESDFARKAMQTEQTMAAARADQGLQGDYDRIKTMKPGEARTAEIDRYNYNLGLRQKQYPLAPMSELPFLDANGKPTDPSIARPGLQSGAGGGRYATAEARSAVREKVIAEAKRQGLNNDQTAYLLGLVEKESAGFNPYAQGPVIKSGTHKGDYAFGPFQIMGKTARGAGIDRFNIDENIRFGVDQFKKGWKKNGRNFAIAQNHHGWNNGRYSPERSDGYTTTGQYVEDIVQRSAKYRGPPQAAQPPVAAAPKPNAGAPKKTGWSILKPGVDVNDPTTWDAKPPVAAKKISMNDSRQVVEHRVTVLDSAGNPHYNSVTQTRVGEPVPAGVGFA